MTGTSKRVRCAIYTRKSSEEGLEQDFNSLHAQREACAAYVLSQASEGWTLLPEIYDDGGISGGTLERPALQRLLADVAAGAIDIIVVYKVDRLTRSLLDFSKLVEAFDKAEVSFVSVTQSFNTTTSMGRLTLNMLLSFAQFEREVTAERIRDKIAASKAKGMWMGGTPPLGYRADGRSLGIVEAHATIVRDIYARYLKLGNVRLLAEQLQQQRIYSPLRQRLSGSEFGGAALSRGQLYAMLKNPIYVGLIPHKERTFPGKHPAIISQDQWDAVQARLQDNTQGQKRVRADRQSLLMGLVRDETGKPLIATHACKGKIRYRYYIGPPAYSDNKPDEPTLRIPARELEDAVISCAARMIGDPLELMARLGVRLDPANFSRANAAAIALAAKVTGKHNETLRRLVSKVTVRRSEIVIDLNGQHLAGSLGLEPATSDIITLISPVRLTRTGRAVRLIQQDGRSSAQEPKEHLIKLILRGRAWSAQQAEGSRDNAAIARDENLTTSYVTRVTRLAFLAPRVVDAILAGEQPANLDTGKLMAPGFPASWAEQERVFLGT